MMASQKNGTIYIWVTSDLVKRVWQHKNHVFEWFTAEYDVTLLVYFECTDTMEVALQREKTLKHWIRDWKVALIEKSNPEWQDLYEDII
jgi:putative endonuclease